MKVIYFLNEFPCYSETFIINQINGLIERGFNVQIIALKIGEIKDIEIIKRYNLLSRTTCLRKIQKKHLLRHLNNLANTLLALKNAAFRRLIIQHLKKKDFSFINYAFVINENRQYKADVIIAHFGPNAVFADNLVEIGCLSGKLYSIFHGYDISQNNVLNKYISEYQKLFKKDIIALPISNLWQEKLLTIGCPSEKIVVNRMGIDTDCFTFNPNVDLNQPLQLLTVARHSEKKGLEFSIQAMKILQNAGIIFQYNIIGTGPLFEQHQQLINKLGLDKSIKLLGYQEPDTINKYLETTDIFILPSVTAQSGDMEGIPVALMEAMAKGVICLSTLHSGIPELIDNEQSGFLVPERDFTSIAKVLIEIVHGKYNLEKIKENALKTILENYNQKHIYDQLADLLRDK